MIVDCLENAENYAGMGERIATAFEYLGKTDFSTMPDGKVEIRGDEIFAMVQRYETKPREQGKWEAHRKHIDIQFLVAGRELIGVGDVNAMCVTEVYSDESDVMFLDSDEGDLITLSKGRFVLLFPHDAHMPSLAEGSPSAVTKVVVKIKVD